MEIILGYCRATLGIGAHIWLILDIFQYFEERKEHKKRKEYIKISFGNLPALRDVFSKQEDYRHYLYNRMLLIEGALANAIIYLYLCI